MALSASLKADIVLDAALLAFRRAVIPIRIFSTAWRKEQKSMQRGDIMKVPYYPIETAASKDFNGTYDFTDAGPNASTKDITVNKRKYQPLITSSTELDRYNHNPEELGKMKGAKLALDVVTDILSLVTAANYGAAAFTGAASTFDADDVADLQLVCDDAFWPSMGRSLLLKNAYRTALLKDNAIQDASAYGDSDPIREGRIERLHGFDIHASAEVPANAQNLVGMAVYQSAICVGFAAITPADSVKEILSAYRVVEDPETGIYMEYRAWGDPDSDSHKEVIEVNYGYAIGEAAAIKRMVSA